jgi:hypothetical protein
LDAAILQQEMGFTSLVHITFMQLKLLSNLIDLAHNLLLVELGLTEVGFLPELHAVLNFSVFALDQLTGVFKSALLLFRLI